MSEVMNLPENAAETPRKMTRAESLAAARAARSAKRASGEESPAKAKAVAESANPELVFWEKAFLQTMINFQVRSAQGLEACVPVANRAVEIWKAKQKEAK